MHINFQHSKYILLIVYDNGIGFPVPTIQTSQMHAKIEDIIQRMNGKYLSIHIITNNRYRKHNFKIFKGLPEVSIFDWALFTI